MVADDAATTLGGLVADRVVASSTVVSDGWLGSVEPEDGKHDLKIVTAAHVVLPWVPRVFANAKR